jgi:CBS domain containing-hemolysin-like protein
VALIITIASATLLASFLCSLFEAALYSLTPARIVVMQRGGIRGADLLAKLKRRVEDPITAILTVNTIAHTIGSAWCGALVGQYYGSKEVGIFAAIFTVLVLALTEIIPKSLGVRYAINIGPHIAFPMQLMIWGVYPIVWVARHAMHALTGSHDGHHPSEDEVITTAGLAAEGGLMRNQEHRWVKNALRLDQITAADLRTPRTVVESLDAATPIAELTSHADTWLHSRVPVTEGGSMDAVIGLVHRREVFDAALLTPEANYVVRDLLRPILFVPEIMAAHDLLQHFLKSKSHMAAVTDEYGGFEGVVTLEDVLECMLGEEIVDEYDLESNMQELARKQNEDRPTGDPDSDT